MNPGHSHAVYLAFRDLNFALIRTAEQARSAAKAMDNLEAATGSSFMTDGLRVRLAWRELQLETLRALRKARAFLAYHAVLALPVGGSFWPLVLWLAPWAGDWAYRERVFADDCVYGAEDEPCGT